MSAKPRGRSYELPAIDGKNWLIHLLYLRKEYEKCLDLIREQLASSNNSCEFAMYMQGLIYRQQGRIQDSLELFQKCTILHPTNITYLKQLAKSLLLLGRFKASLELFSEIINKFEEKDWQLYHDQGVACTFLQQYPQAVDRFLQALELKPQEETFLMLAKVHISSGKLDAALEVYKKGVELFPDSAQLFSNLGLLYLQQDDFKKAGECLDKAATINPSNNGAVLASGSIRHSLGDYDGAMTRYRQAAAETPDSAALWNNVGMCYFEKAKHLTAISCLKRAAYLSPMDWKILFNLGLVHLTVGLNASAFHYISAAIAHKPRAKLFMFLAIALARLEDMNHAKLAYEQALEMDKAGDPTIILNAALFYINCGDHARAVTLMTKCNENIQKIKSSGRALDEKMVQKATQVTEFLQTGKTPSSVTEDSAKSTSASAKPKPKPFTTDKEQITRGSSFFQTIALDGSDSLAEITSAAEKKPQEKPSDDKKPGSAERNKKVESFYVRENTEENTSVQPHGRSEETTAQSKQRVGSNNESSDFW